MSKTLYQSLGLLPDASADDIAHIISHARKMGSVDDKILNAAEEHLLDEQKRAAYDGFLVQTLQVKSAGAVFASGQQSQNASKSVAEKKTEAATPAPKKEKKTAPVAKSEPVVQKQIKLPDEPEIKAPTKVIQNREPLTWEEPEIKSSAVAKPIETEEVTVPEKILCKGCARPLRARSRFCDQCGTKVEEQEKVIPVHILEQKKAALLAIFLGGFGAHKFYLGQIKYGIFYLLFIWTLIPVLLGIIEGVRLFQLPEDQFTKQYGFLIEPKTDH